MKFNASVALLGLLGAFAAQADLLVYEPFDYTPDLSDAVAGAQNGKDGGIGFAGAWEDMTAGSNNGEGFIFDSLGNTNGTNGSKPDWDGVVDNLPQLGGYVGLSPFSNDQIEDRNNARRALAQSAGAMAGPDRVLWMSMAVHFEDNRFNFAPGLLLTDGGGLSERSRDITDNSTGIGIGHGSAWGIDLNAVTYNAGVFDTRTDVSNISTTLDNVIVLKFEFGDTADTVSSWYFTEDQTMTEADFNANALSTTSTFNIDETTLTTLAVGITRAGNAYDEIRIGDTFLDVISPATAGAVDADVSTVVASPTNVPADGTTTSTITVTLKDSAGLPVENKEVTLANTAGPGIPTITPTTAQATDATGAVTFTVSSSTVGVEEFTATDVTDGNLAITQTASVDFESVVVIGPVDAGVSTVEASPASVLADGLATSSITVTLKDAAGLAVEGKEVSLANTAGPQAAVIAPAGNVTTGVDGEASFMVSSSTAGTEVFTATDVTDGNLVITQTTSVEFVVPDPPALLVYEPFDYAPNLGDAVAGAQNGKNGGIGFAGAWEDMTSGSNNGEGFIFDSLGNTSGSNGAKPDWDGVVDNLPQIGGYVGLSPFSNDQLEDRNNARRALAQSAGAMAGADRVLWMSMAVHFEDNRFNFSPGLLLTDGGGFSERSRDITDGSTGIGIGHGTSNPSWGLDLNAVTYNAGAFDTRTDISNISTTLDNVIVLKFEFGDTSDTVSSWYFTEDQTMDEATFNANALSTASTFNIDEDTLTTLAVGLTRAGNAYDEIRIGNTFDDVISAPLALITDFGIPGSKGVIDQGAKTIALEVPFGTDLATLAPEFTLTTGTCDQASGAAPSPTFAASNPANYVVTDSSTDPDTVNTYVVTVNVAPQLGTLVIDLGAGTVIEGGTFGTYGATNLPLPSLPAGSILKSIAVDTALEATDNENFASDLSVLLDPTPGIPGGDFSVSITNGDQNFGAALELDWPAAGDAGPVTSLVDTKTASDWSAAGAIDLATTGLFLGNGHGGPTVGGSWSGTITLSYEIPAGGGDYDTWAAGFLPDDVSDPNADLDRDGLTNGDERVFGLDPTDPSSMNPITVPLVAAAGTFSYTRRDQALTGLNYKVWTSPDLQNWMEDPGAVQVPGAVVDDVQPVGVTLTATPVDGKLFVQVRAD